MTPKNEKNFLVELTPEQMHELNKVYVNSDQNPYEELHYSPYWKDLRGNQ